MRRRVREVAGCWNKVAVLPSTLPLFLNSVLLIIFKNIVITVLHKLAKAVPSRPVEYIKRFSFPPTALL